VGFVAGTSNEQSYRLHQIDDVLLESPGRHDVWNVISWACVRMDVISQTCKINLQVWLFSVNLERWVGPQSAPW
jgi:hypothetical protein